MEIILKPEIREREFLQFGNKLSELESKYFQFLKPEIIESLIQIQQECSNLEHITNFAVIIPAFFSAIADSGIIKTEQLPKKIERIEIEPMIETIFLNIVKEIDNLRNQGITLFQKNEKS